MSDTEECLINVAAAAAAAASASASHQYSHHHPSSSAANIGAPSLHKQQQLEDDSSGSSSSDSDSEDSDDDSDDDEHTAKDQDQQSDSGEVVPAKRAKLAAESAPAISAPSVIQTISSSSRINERRSPPAPLAEPAEVPVPVPANSNVHVVATHYNKLEEKGLAERSQSRIFHMRNFNNWIKSMLINEYITRIRNSSKLGEALRVLDMCCGKGGDLYKWEKANITHLICTDIAAVSVEQCEARYRALTQRHSAGGGQKFGGTKFFTAEFFACDSTRTRLRSQYADPSIDLHLVSCQFAFHYCFESLPQAECMIRNAAECLKTGGYFIGTIPDAFEIVRRQRAQCAGGEQSFGNELYKIGFQCDAEEPPLFGGKYNFQLQGVVDCPEFLVHFPLLEKLARKHGLKLEMKESFGGYFRKMIDQSKGLIEKMQGLQTYPSHEHQQRNQSAEQLAQFAHAAEFLRQRDGGGHNRNQKCGTLSKAEWEATSIYIVFAFKKMKKLYDNKGQLYFDFD